MIQTQTMVTDARESARWSADSNATGAVHPHLTTASLLAETEFLLRERYAMMGTM